MSRTNDRTPGGQTPAGGKRADPDATGTGSAGQTGDREREVADLDGTAGDVSDVGAAQGASNAGRTRTSGGDA